MNTKILKFYAEWCGPCRAMKPTIEKFKETIGAAEGFVEEIDIDTNPDATMKYDIKSVPTLIFIKDGVEVERVRGAISLTDLIEKTRKNLADNIFKRISK